MRETPKRLSETRWSRRRAPIDRCPHLGERLQPAFGPRASLGAGAIVGGRGLYNEVITATNNEQTLELIVRARYGEPAGLSVATVTAVPAVVSTAAQFGIGPSSNYSGNLVPLRSVSLSASNTEPMRSRARRSVGAGVRTAPTAARASASGVPARSIASSTTSRSGEGAYAGRPCDGLRERGIGLGADGVIKRLAPATPSIMQ